VAKKMFTEAGLERLRDPDKGRVEYGDSVVPGLMLRVSETDCGSRIRAFSCTERVDANAFYRRDCHHVAISPNKIITGRANSRTVHTVSAIPKTRPARRTRGRPPA
jgi:hypothetical protein